MAVIPGQVPQPASAPVAPMQKPKPAPLPQFDVLRNQATQRATAAGQQQKEALDRRLAAMGNLNSGAALKQHENMDMNVNAQREEAINQVNAAEMQEQSRLGEAETGRNFAAAEAEKARNFQGDFQRDVFAEQKRQNQFTEKLAMDEHKLSKYNTMYNTALSYGTSEAKGAIDEAFAMLFPKQNMSYGAGNNANAIKRSQAKNSSLNSAEKRQKESEFKQATGGLLGRGTP